MKDLHVMPRGMQDYKEEHQLPREPYAFAVIKTNATPMIKKLCEAGQHLLAKRPVDWQHSKVEMAARSACCIVPELIAC